MISLLGKNEIFSFLYSLFVNYLFRGRLVVPYSEGVIWMNDRLQYPLIFSSRFFCLGAALSTFAFFAFPQLFFGLVLGSLFLFLFLYIYKKKKEAPV